MNDTIDLLQEIKKPTEFKNPGSSFKMPELKESDFEDNPYIPLNSEFTEDFVKRDTQNINTENTQPGTTITDPPKQQVFNPDFTSEIVIDSIDTIQHSLFLALNNRKQKGIRFKNRDEYRESISLSYLTDSELEKLENPEEKKMKVEKLKAFQTKMEQLNDKLSFTPDEQMRLKKPIFELIKRSNFDIPPGLALFLVSMDILSNRVIDLIYD